MAPREAADSRNWWNGLPAISFDILPKEQFMVKKKAISADFPPSGANLFQAVKYIGHAGRPQSVKNLLATPVINHKANITQYSEMI